MAVQLDEIVRRCINRYLSDDELASCNERQRRFRSMVFKAAFFLTFTGLSCPLLPATLVPQPRLQKSALI